MYCVQCGVELAPGTAECPLCKTPVLSPDPVRPEDYRPLFPQKQSQTKTRMGNGLKAILIALILMIPAVSVLISDLSLSGRISWSGLVLGGLAVFFVFLTSPMYGREPRLGVVLFLDAAAVLLYLLYLEDYTGGRWFVPFALPLTVVFFLCLALIGLLTEKKRLSVLKTVGVSLFILAAFCVICDLLIHLAFLSAFGISWSQYPLFILLLLGGICFAADRSETLKEKLKKKFFL
ncbi:MAG: hypothetical protein IJR89_00960 [Clostridia bacterium]|nr:hypothetical protein [Clostridia bacterium]